MEILDSPWPWYVTGPLIGLMVPLLLLMGNRQFGISGSLRDFLAVVLQRKSGVLAYDAESSNWRLWFSLGVVGAGAILALVHLPAQTGISAAAKSSLAASGIVNFEGFFPKQLLGGLDGFSLMQVVYCIVGGLLVGFGTRYAGGCTSGHSIMGLSQLSLPSLIATCSFFAGGLTMTHLIFPSLLPWLLSF